MKKNRVLKLTVENFPDNFNKPSVILFSREGCHFCKKLKPVYNRISAMEDFQQIYDFYIIDSDQEPLLYHKFQADGVPTMYVIYEEDGLEIPYPENGYDEKYLIKFLNELME